MSQSEIVVGIASDSICNVIAVNDKLNAAAYRQGWHMASKPGATSNNLLTLLRRLDKQQPTHVIISCLSNEMANIHTVDNIRDSSLETIAANITEALDYLLQRNTEVVIMLPHPREPNYKTTGGFDLEIKQEIDLVVKNIVAHYPNTRTVDISEGIEPTTFIREYLRDKVHIHRTKAAEIFEKVAHSLGVQPLIPTTNIQTSEYMPHVCSACGKNHANWGRTFCAKAKKCTMCDVKGHTRAVCRYNVLMCHRCGDRGHSPTDPYIHPNPFGYSQRK